MVHIVEFTADLIRNHKLNLTPSRNDNLKVTFHDSCNPARGMGLFEEPRYVIQNVCNHFYEMPAEHHPRADLLLRQRGGPECRGEHGDAHARRHAAGQRRQARARRSTASTCWPASAPSTGPPCPR